MLSFRLDHAGWHQLQVWVRPSIPNLCTFVCPPPFLFLSPSFPFFYCYLLPSTFKAAKGPCFSTSLSCKLPPDQCSSAPYPSTPQLCWRGGRLGAGKAQALLVAQGIWFAGFLFLFLFVFGPHQAVLGYYYWWHLEDPVVLGIEPRTLKGNASSGPHEPLSGLVGSSGLTPGVWTSCSHHFQDFLPLLPPCNVFTVCPDDPPACLGLHRTCPMTTFCSCSL